MFVEGIPQYNLFYSATRLVPLGRLPDQILEDSGALQDQNLKDFGQIFIDFCTNSDQIFDRFSPLFALPLVGEQYG